MALVAAKTEPKEEPSEEAGLGQGPLGDVKADLPEGVQEAPQGQGGGDHDESSFATHLDIFTCPKIRFDRRYELGTMEEEGARNPYLIFSREEVAEQSQPEQAALPQASAPPPPPPPCVACSGAQDSEVQGEVETVKRRKRTSTSTRSTLERGRSSECL